MPLPPIAQVAEPPAPATPGGRRLGWCLLALAYAIALAAGLRHVDRPWESGMRGEMAAAYTDGAVATTLAHGLAVTKGLPTILVPTDQAPQQFIAWHHPPYYWLYETLAAWLAGHRPLVLRLAHLLLYLPGILALYQLARRRLGPVLAGCACVLFASCPQVAYFGPMVLQDGAVLGLGLVTAAAFGRHLAAPRLGTWVLTAIAYFLVCCLDYPGYFWGPALLFLVPGQPRPWRAARDVVLLAPVAVAAFALTACHYGLVMGGPAGFVRSMLQIASLEHQVAPNDGGPTVASALHDLLVVYCCWPTASLAALGGLLAVWRRPAGGRNVLLLVAALALPGILNCTVFFRHSLQHPFWSMHGAAGVAVLAAVVPWLACRLLAGPMRVRALAIGLLLATVATAAVGTLATHAILERHACPATAAPSYLEQVAPRFQGCAFALASHMDATQAFYGTTMVIGPIATEAALDQVLSLGRANLYQGDVAFVLHPLQQGSGLQRRLDTMATPQRVGDILLYRFPVR